jgi:hypothetical protein
LKITIFIIVVFITFYSTGIASELDPRGIPPLDEWTCPKSHPIKGNINTRKETMIYHAPGGAYYNKTKPEQCFVSEKDAKAAGFRKSKR